MMYWIRKQIWLWRDFGDDHPFITLGLVAFMLIGGVIWGSLAGGYLRPLLNPPAAAATPTPAFTSTPSHTPKHKATRTRSEVVQPTYRPRPTHTVPRPVRTSHAPSPPSSPSPTKTKKHGPCWHKLVCPPSSQTPGPPNSPPPTPTPGS